MTEYSGLAHAPAHLKLAGYFGIDGELQRRVGTAIILLGMVEAEIERTVWAFSGESIAAVSANTDRVNVAEMIGRLREFASAAPREPLMQLLVLALDLVEHLLVARHTIAHGAPAVAAARPELRRNASWLGEARRRPATQLALDERTLDDVASAADAAFTALSRIGAVRAGLPIEYALKMKPSLLDHNRLIGSFAKKRVVAGDS